MAEEYCCPAFLICLDGDHGKASSRSYGGFNLFSSLTKLAPLLESYGGHELAAGFTITRQQIPSFRQAICELAEQHYTDGVCRTQIEIDCAVTPELLTVRGIDSLSALEPCGNGCPKPVLMMEKLTVDRISLVGGGRHMRLRFRDRFHTINAIFFSATPESASVQPGDVVDVAFYPQINEFKGERSVQMNVLDIRPHCDAPCDTNTAGYAGLRKGETTPAEAAQLLPDRNTLGTVWRYLAGAEAPLREEPMCLCRKIVRWSGKSLTLGQLLTALDIFRDVGLLEIQKQRKTLTLIPTPGPNKADLNESKTMQTLLKAKES
jgi:single-stranded-DNA-specific exonuclease